MAFKYVITQTARTELDNIVSYISIDLGNKKAASNFINKLQETINNVILFPESGSVVENDFLPNKNIRRKIIDNYILYYTPDFSNETIYILRIVHGKQNIDDILKNLKYN